MGMTKLHTYIDKGRGKKTGAYPHKDKAGQYKGKMSGFGQHPGHDAVYAGRSMNGYGSHKSDYPGMGTKKAVDTERKQDN